MTGSRASEAAIREWTAALGPARVTRGEAVLARYSRSTSRFSTRPSCILYPEATAEVQAIAAIASRHGAPLYPISRGRNWGYGDACALEDGAAIIDLSRMNRILETNRSLAYVTIEAGVSQGDLYDYLQREAPDLWMDCTGAGPGASVVGNLLERGFGHTPLADHASNSGPLEVVLPGGQVLRTGLGRFAGARAAPVYPHGVGPSINGLFFQSNLGVVTRATVWLAPRPEAFCFFYLTIGDDAALPALVERLRALRFDGALQSAVHVGNDLKITTSTGRYPWEEAGGVTPLPPALRYALRQDMGAGAWNLSGSLTGTHGAVAHRRKLLRKALAPFGRVRFLTDARLAWAERWLAWTPPSPWKRRGQERIETLKPYYGLLKGQPTDAFLRSAQWRLRNPPSQAPGAAPPDPLDAGCGLLWLSPVLPMTGGDAEAVVTGLEPIFNRHGFDFPVSFTMLSCRALIAIASILFDQGDTASAEAAEACYDEALEWMMASGYPPYRIGVQGMAACLQREDGAFAALTGGVKALLDPEDILASGRYIARRRED